MRLVFKGIDLPATYEVHFSNDELGTAKTSIGGEDGALIPDEYLISGDPVHAWVFLHTGDEDGETDVMHWISDIDGNAPLYWSEV